MFGATKKLQDIKVTSDAFPGVKDLGEVLDLLETGLKAAKDALASGSITWIDLPKFAPVLSMIKPAIEGIKNCWAEVKDLDQAEAQHVFERITTIVALAAELFPAQAA